MFWLIFLIIIAVVFPGIVQALGVVFNLIIAALIIIYVVGPVVMFFVKKLFGGNGN